MLRYASYNENQDAKLAFFDAHPGYQADADIWGGHRENVRSRATRLFVHNAVRDECFWC